MAPTQSSTSPNNATRLTASALVQHNNYFNANPARRRSPEPLPSGGRCLKLSEQSTNDHRMWAETRKAWATSQIKAFETAFYIGRGSGR